MTYKEYADKAKEILEAIKNGNYEEDVEAPNFVDEHEHNGRVVLVVCDNDGPRSSNDCGSASYTVCGEEFSVERDFYGENESVESSFFDMAENLEDRTEELADEVEGLIEQISDEIRWLVPSMDDIDSQAAAYAEANGITDYEVVWYEDFDEESFYSDDEESDDEESDDDDSY